MSTSLKSFIAEKKREKGEKRTKEIEEAVEFAMESQYPSPDEILDNLFE